MEAVVSDILASRKREHAARGQATSATALSFAAHGAVIAGLFLLPNILPRSEVPPPAGMTISLGGSTGPENGGMTMLGGRTIQPAEPTETPKLDRIALPAPKPEPAMTVPVPDPRLKARTPPKQTVNDTKGRSNGRGAEAQKGNETVETGARGMGFGLSTSAGGGTGGVRLDVNFCCPEYLTEMASRIREHWNPQVQGIGQVIMKFTIKRSGELTDIEVERSSNIFALDQASQRALYLTAKLPPLPSAFADDHLTVHLTFEYERR